MNNLHQIKENDFLKYFKNLFKVKSVDKQDNGAVVINFYYRSLKQHNAKLYKDGVYKIYPEYLTEKLKRATSEEIKFLLSRIRNLNSEKIGINNINLIELKNNENLNEVECIDFLKSRGYLIYKRQ